VTVRIEDREPGIRMLLLDRPASRNAIDMSVVRGLHEGLASAAGGVVILSSTAPASFSSGADLGLSDDERKAVSDGLYDLYMLMRSTPRPIIAAASGHAVGGGAQLLIASDLRIAGPDLAIRFMGPGHGLAVGAWGLPSLVGRGRAIDLCLSMRPVGAEEALSIGLVDRVAADPLDEATAYARHILSLDSEAVAAVKRISDVPDPNRALSLEMEHNAGWDGAAAPRE